MGAPYSGPFSPGNPKLKAAVGLWPSVLFRLVRLKDRFFPFP